MDAKYDGKFEEMKKYIPFLESMIKRLESTSSSSANPRQAQLDKIRSLRDLLLDKKKRMKMENLLKCEQVLINLYAKVEQRDSFVSTKNDDLQFSIDSPTQKEKSELEAVRNKLKTVVKLKDRTEDTLPEIARANEIEEICTSGSKEPALFQRRPNASAISPSIVNKTKEDVGSGSKRNYTRVLVSPEPPVRNWSPSKSSGDKLFSRRSPRRSPRRRSPSYHKKERKKSSKESHSRKSKDFNITLNVPEESLGSLNTKDILSRIINCSDSDVDIDTLRELRKQILGELKNTGTNDDLTDIILKSYKKSKIQKKSKNQQGSKKKNDDVEEGELSDSESEAIQSIYGSLVVKEQNVASQFVNETDKVEPRKIQICLVINSEKDSGSTPSNEDTAAGITDGLNPTPSQVITIDDDDEHKNITSSSGATVDSSAIKSKHNISTEMCTTEKELINTVDKNIEPISDPPSTDSCLDLLEKPTNHEQSNIVSESKTLIDNVVVTNSKPPVEAIDSLKETRQENSGSFKANFYKPLLEQEKLESLEIVECKQSSIKDTSVPSENKEQDNNVLRNDPSKVNHTETAVEIPLLNEPNVSTKTTSSVVSEIEILQALKNEILSETIVLPETETCTTPALHQPKVNKVLSAKEILPKKRISIEKYKEKSVTAPAHLGINLFSHMHKDLKKSRIKLTEKECERFNIPKMSPDDDSSIDDEKDQEQISIHDIYSDLAPQSPEEDQMSDFKGNSPVLIPQDPVKPVMAININADIDMRTLPIVSTNPNVIGYGSVLSPNVSNVMDFHKDDTRYERSKGFSDNKTPLDPRIRRDQAINKESPKPHLDRTPSSIPNINCTMTPNSRPYEMTPSHQTFEFAPSQNHIYAPSCSMFERQDREKDIPVWETSEPKIERKSRFEDTSRKWDDRNNSLSRDLLPNSREISRRDRYGQDKRDDYLITHSDCPQTPLPSFGRSDAPQYGRLETPMTPSHPFGRIDCPPTPSHSFGRSDCPSTPIHPFGRSDCPSTPIHPFGRSDCPSTPIHPFGRSDCPSTPSHPFGRPEGSQFQNHPFSSHESVPHPVPGFDRIECPQTPNHPFGRSDNVVQGHSYGRSEYTQKFIKDPRLNRNTEYEMSPRRDDNDRDYSKNKLNSSSYKGRNTIFNGPELYRSRDREQSVNKNDKYHYTNQEKLGRFYNKDQSESRWSVSKEYGDGQFFSKDGSLKYDKNPQDCSEVGSRRSSRADKHINLTTDHRNTVRARSIGRSVTCRSFDIDTSVNSTFQNFKGDNKIIPDFGSFTARQKRASSVGRSLVDEHTVDKILPEENRPRNDTDFKREAFKRASSVGRELANDSTERKTFQEVKADLRMYRPKSNCSDAQTSEKKHHDGSRRDMYENKIERNKRDSYENRQNIPEEKRTSSTSKSMYSPRKNTRDPRMQTNVDSKLYRQNIKHRSKYTWVRNSGIDYSRDNIAKGTVLGSGGVKNYKIPKIKRPVEEKEQENTSKDADKTPQDKLNKGQVKDKGNVVNEVKKDALIIEKNKDKAKKPIKSKLIVEEQVGDIDGNSKNTTINKEYAPQELKPTQSTRKDYNIKEKIENATNENNSDNELVRRITRSTARVQSVSSNETSPIVVRKKRNRKPILRDSSSDSDKSTASKIEDNECRTNQPGSDKEIELNKEQGEDIELDSNFGLDEMFSENPTDTVHDNISALIAGLYNEVDPLNASENIHISKENVTPHMLKSIGSSDNSNETDNIVLSMPLKNTNLGETTITNTAALIDDKPEQICEKDLPTQNKMSNTAENIQETNFNECLTNDNLLTAPTNLTISGLEQGRVVPPKSSTLKITECVVDSKDTTSLSEFNKDQVIDEDRTNNAKPLSQPLGGSESDVSKSKSSKGNVDDVVTTSEIDSNLINPISNVTEQSDQYASTPDSTIDNDEKSLDKVKNVANTSLPDSSTHEEHNDTNVTSTDSVEIKPVEQCRASTVQTPSGLDTIGNLLSLLQDKSKIKEVLSMLGSQGSDNNKIKKKLEKLSEIMSDEDETNETPTMENIDESKFIDENHKEEQPEISTAQEEIHSDITSKPSKDEETLITRDLEKTIVEYSNDDLPQSEHEPSEKILDDIPPEPEPKIQPKRTTKAMKKGKGKIIKKVDTIDEKRITRAVAAQPKLKKPSRELLKLQEDIKEMFIKDDVLNSTGIRMCRLAKLVDGKNPPRDDTVTTEIEPMIVIEKIKNSTKYDELASQGKKKKLLPKSKLPKTLKTCPLEIDAEKKTLPTLRPGPKSKTKEKNTDPYAFETDSIDTTTEKTSDDDLESDSEVSSVSSSKSFGSTECLADIKKKTKRKRGRWQVGVIKSKCKKKKVNPKVSDPVIDNVDNSHCEKPVPDINCFTDRNYYFHKGTTDYACRICAYSGSDIVHHYKKSHPHIEIPLSRMAPIVAKEAIDQCKEINFQAVSRVPSDKYICIFCFKEFNKKAKSILEDFFWHIVSTHTGEYKQACSDCPSENQCPFNLDIPSPPKEVKGQLIGYICKKCNFTQISLENLKTHVIVRHNDEQTAVYTINLSVMTKKAFKSFLRYCSGPEPRLLRSGRSNQSLTEGTDNLGEVTESSRCSESENEQKVCQAEKERILQLASTSIQSKLTFEGDDNNEPTGAGDNVGEKTIIKVERIESDESEPVPRADVESKSFDKMPCDDPSVAGGDQPDEVSDIVDYPHFKISYNDSGSKEYVCCINAIDSHFRTALLISMKKHVQMKHTENWDGYCYVCKVIVTPQGSHCFKDCLQHYLDTHMDNFPILETNTQESKSNESFEAVEKNYINVRPLSELISKSSEPPLPESTGFPIIERVVSLGAQTVEAPRPSPTYPILRTEKEDVSEAPMKYEEVQAEVMSNKHRVVLEAMMVPEKLIKVFKCAGRFCSFATDSAEDALLHASTHQRIGGIDVLKCSYCDFDSGSNAIDLVMHVFKAHGGCQYSCGQCFYRAAASQLVGAHMARLHSSTPAGPVLRTTMVSAPVAETAMLTRDQAVSYYVCGHGEQYEKCKFRTYTPDKFCEHLQLKHSSATSYPCNVCSSSVNSPLELIQHMKCHGLKLYQCTWCVHGADNEEELLAHVSAVHPSKQPQAYLRIITNKEGSGELRVLPLAFLNKTQIPTEDVVPSSSIENPVREAERSINLEKLIGHASMLIDSIQETATNLNAETSALEVSTSFLVEPTLNSSDTMNDPNISPETSVPPPVFTPASIVSTPATPPPPMPSTTENALEETPILKTEPVATIPKNRQFSQIVVLDSDDEEPTSSALETSNEDLTSFKKISMNAIHVCPRCRTKCKTLAGLKKHMFTCIPTGIAELPCPHCKFIAKDKVELFDHYLIDHRVAITCNCGICGASIKSMPMAKRHVKLVHKIDEIEVSSKVEKGVYYYFIEPRSGKRVLPKRKLSGGPAEAPNAKRRYGPQDVDQLPINPILDQSVCCSECEFSTKVRLNMVRHLQMHAEQQPVPETAPVNPVPHLETNEMHFDRMVNLASSSVVNRVPEKAPRPESEPSVSLLIPPEAASRYPKYVPERQRLTCGAKECSYISVDENMFRFHWETLHAGTNEYHCVHCPPYQHLDTSKPLTASRILAHLKMHDVTLYACSPCSYYHYRREALEKHLSEVHKGGKMVVVREEASASTSAPVTQAAAAAPTMDLKPWQCGLCKFKSMLRPEVAEHCAKVHQSKMQFKCNYCPFRTSAMENVSKHQTNAHSEKPKDVFYYYYREGQVADEPDGVPKWQKQRQKAGVTEIKTEARGSSPPSPAMNPLPTPNHTSFDLSLVKKEKDSDELISGVELSIEELCDKLGAFCEPNGLYYRCSLCKVVTEDDRDAMQSHLYEELKYRKWGCGLCSYKAFHKAGLNEHMASEHRRKYQNPIELPTDQNMEKWVKAHLDYQKNIIEKNRGSVANLKISTPQSVPGPSKPTDTSSVENSKEKYDMEKLQENFGAFGSPTESQFTCPKCNFVSKDENAFKDHLETELNKIRWCCSNCPLTFPSYHEAQFHCKSHVGGAARPREAVRDPTMRQAWVSTVIETQKQDLKTDVTDLPEEATDSSDDNSLLVVRYEERVPTPVDTLPVRRKRPAPDSDDEKLVINEGPQKNNIHACSYCDYKSKYKNVLREHVYRHYNLRPFTCVYCSFSSYKQGVFNHTERAHPGKKPSVKYTEIPDDAVLVTDLAQPKKKQVDADELKLTCMECGKIVFESETAAHLHDGKKPEYRKKGDVVVKCCICLVLRVDVKSLQDHHNAAHPHIPINYAYFKLQHSTRDTLFCGYCKKGFKYLMDLKSHHESTHSSCQLMYTSSTLAKLEGSQKIDDSTAETPVKRCARKSTTKLPYSCPVAKKSTTKLPFSVPDTEYSFYNTKPTPLENYAHVTTLMPVMNTMMPFTVDMLNAHMKIEPKVLVRDFRLES